MGLALGHQRFAGKAGIGPQSDAHLRPAGADLGHDPDDLCERAG